MSSLVRSEQITFCVSFINTLIGHSERRTLFHETSDLVATKTKAAIEVGLKVILCIGETLQEREANKTAEVCEAQLKAVVDVIKEADWRWVDQLVCLGNTNALFSWNSKIVVAYEPVWAIGTGKVATTQQAQDAHADVRSYLAKAVSPAVANEIQILYGGSVNAGNCKELGKLPST